MRDLLTALALVFFIEGLLYAAAPDRMKTFIALALEMDSCTLRRGGLIAMAVGLLAIWAIRAG